MTDVEFLDKWISEVPHREGCVAITAQAEIACTCGKKEAKEAFENLELGCDGDCEISSKLDKMRLKLTNLVTSHEYPKLKREEVKEKIEEIAHDD